MRLIELLKNVLESDGIGYSEKNGTVQLILCCGSHKWNVSFAEDEESFLRYYARYPWQISVEDEGRVLTRLNRLNERLRAGCFMISGGYPVFRYGVYIFDEFTANESIADLILTASAKTEAEWQQVYSAVYSQARFSSGNTE